jgi:hypothetical protein
VRCADERARLTSSRIPLILPGMKIDGALTTLELTAVHHHIIR